MYTVKKLFLKVKPFEKWDIVTPDQNNFNKLVNSPLRSLAAAYHTVLVMVSIDYSDEDKFLNLSALASIINDNATPLTSYLKQNTHVNLPWSDITYSPVNKSVLYANPFRIGYKVTSIGRGRAIDADILPSDKIDLALSKDQVDPLEFGKYCLVTVGGLLHYVETSPTQIIVLDGNKPLLNHNNDEIGIISFKGVGSITTKPITKEMILPLQDNVAYKDTVYLKIGTELKGKTPLLSIGGFLTPLSSDVIFQVSDEVIGIRMCKLPLLERYFISKDIIDLSPLGLIASSKNSEEIAVSDLLCDEGIIKLLTLSQSFVVLVNNVNLYTNLHYLQSTKITDNFISHIAPKYPLIGPYGKLMDYVWREEGARHLVLTKNSRSPNYLFNTARKSQLKCVTPACDPAKPYTPFSVFYSVISTQFPTE